MVDEFDLEKIDAPIMVTAEYVLDQIDDLLIYRHYIGPFQLGRPIKSPLRAPVKGTPSFSITVNPNWLKLMWKDFATDEVGDCFKLVARMYNLSYYEAVDKVACDFGLVKGNSIVSKKQILEARQFKEEFQRKEVFIQVDRRKMNSEELGYWKQYCLSREDLLADYVYGINKLWINKKIMNLDVSTIHFAYHMPEIDKWKIYSPLSKDFKWFGNVPNSHMEGITPEKWDLTKPIIVAKSRKDRMVLKKLYTNVCSTQNESEYAIPREMDVLFDSYPAKYCWFDSDEPGKNANRKLNRRGYKWINIPNDIYEKDGTKDPSDAIKNYNWEKGSEILLNEMKRKGL